MSTKISDLAGPDISAYKKVEKILLKKLKFFNAKEILATYLDLPRKERETKLLQEHKAVFILGIGSVLKDGYPREM
ncbi:MAG: hypothetical protein AAGA64_06455 [Bacteroidota bacterium]